MALEGGDAAGVDLLAIPVIDRAAGLDAGALDPGQHDLVADLDLGDRAADLQHRAGAFVAQAMRHPFVLALVAAPFHHLGAAGAGIGDLDQHLSGLQRRRLDVGQHERLAGLDQEGSLGFHHLRSQLNAWTILSAIWWPVSPSTSRAYSCSPDFLKKASGVPK